MLDAGSVAGLCWNVAARTFEHDAVLVQLREHGRDLALAEGVVERVVDRLRRDAEPRRRIAVDHQLAPASPWFC